MTVSASSGMILHEATDADVSELAPFLQRQLTAWGFDANATVAIVRALIKGRRRYAYVTEDDVIVAVGAFHPIETEYGSAYEIPVFVSSIDHPDKVRVMDALAIFICNLLRSEGILILTSRRPDHPHIAGLYDRYGFVDVPGTDGFRRVQTETPIANVLRERPEWRPSP